MSNEDEIEPQKTTDINERLMWSLEMVEQLIEVLHEVFQVGGAADNSFKKATFELAVTKVRGVYKGPLDITQEKCKNKWADIKKKWGHWVCLSEQSGFGFNPETELYEAYDYVWDNLNKSKPTIIWHKTHTLHHRDLIGEILHEAQATGKSAFTTTDPTPIDPRLLAYDIDTPTSSVSPAPGAKSTVAYNKSKKRLRAEGEDDEDKVAVVHKKVDLGFAITGLTEEMALGRKAKEGFKTIPQQAIQLLEKEYRKRLHIMAFIQAITFFKDEGNAGTFVALTELETRDRYLEIVVGVELDQGDSS